MNHLSRQVLDYLGYKNKMKTVEWEERLWLRHLGETPCDVRRDEDRQRYFGLLERIEQSRQLAQRLHLRRTAHAPRFS